MGLCCFFKVCRGLFTHNELNRSMMCISRTACLFVLGTLFMSCSATQQAKEEIVINLQERGADIAPSMYGVFFEEINHAGDGGLYAELVQNRSFEEKEMPAGFHAEGNRLLPKPVKYHLTGEVRNRSYRWNTAEVPAWSLQRKDSLAAQMKVTEESPKFKTAPHNLKLFIKDASQPVRLLNEGYWGMNIVKGGNYFLRSIIRTSEDYHGTVSVKLLSEDGTVLASEILDITTDGQWNDVRETLTAVGQDTRARLALEFDAPGTIWVDYVSLFPENTFNNRPNGLRRDVADMLVGLRPSFFRWPGGCVVEGITLDNRFEWKKTLGDPATRPGEYSTWGYRCSYGFGYYEMLQFCEDIGAKAMYVCNVGLGCQFRMGDACPENEIAFYMDDCMDAIEYALGDETTEWGARRAADGHPAPFPLQYVEIGNENWGPEYDRRFDMFYKAIKEKYPELILIYNEMPQREGPSAIAKTDMIDPHWYVDPYFFFRNTTLFDSYERGKYHVYVGEYACNRSVGAGNMLAALSEAAFIGGMERNGDLVTMASYAPLFENCHDRSWETNLIWIDTDQVLGRSSYYVQKMSAENCPTYNVKSNITMHDVEPEWFDKGYIGFGAASATVRFKDIKVTRNGVSEMPDMSGFVFKDGEWEVDEASGSLSVAKGKQILLQEPYGGDFVLECKVYKTEGTQGFQFFLGMSADGKTGYRYNIGMWSSNDRSELLNLKNGKERGVLAEYSGEAIKKGEWYDVKIVVSPLKSEFYLNGKQILSYVPQPMPLQFINSGYDEAVGELVVKVVNAADSLYCTSICLENAVDIVAEGKVISLTAVDGKEENSFEEPKKIYPEEKIFDGFGAKFDYDFPPFSYTVLRIKAKPLSDSY